VKIEPERAKLKYLQLEDVARERLVKHRLEKGLAGIVVICELWTLMVVV
jgi:hypothetical protein